MRGSRRYGWDKGSVTYGHTDGRTYGRTDGRTDIHEGKNNIWPKGIFIEKFNFIRCGKFLIT